MSKYITLDERRIIETMLQDGKNPKEIAKRIKKHYTTIYKEIKLGTMKILNSDLTYRYEYQFDYAQRIHDERSHNKGVDIKLGNDYRLADDIERLIRDNNYSPYAVAEYIKKNRIDYQMTICEKTIYNYIDMGIFLNVTNKDLPLKRNRKRKYKQIRTIKSRLKGKSIEERPKSISKREKYGHWEMDTVVSGKKKCKECLLVLTERMTRQEYILKMIDKSAQSTVQCLDKLEKRLGKKRFRETFKTITTDNGTEFKDIKGMEKDGRTTTYLCHPYSSYERGSNENANKLIRRFIPKGSDISKYTDKDIQQIETWINNYPRKLFNGLSSNEILASII